MSILSPSASPSALMDGVKRVNRVPLIIAICTIAAIVLMVGIVAMDRADQANVAPAEEVKPTVKTSVPSFIDEMAAKYPSEIKSAEEVEVEAPAPSESEVDQQLAAEAAAAPSDPVAPPGPQLSEEEKQMIQMFNQRKLQFFETALAAKSSVDVEGVKAAQLAAMKAPAESREGQLEAVRSRMAADPNATYDDRVRAVQAAYNADGEAGTMQVASQAADGAADEESWLLPHKVEASRSPYELRSGFVIPGSLISGINSDLKGEIIAQVSQNVYDNATGRYLLIPQFSRLEGTYSDEVTFGQERVHCVWRRLVYPDGSALSLGNMPCADQAGYSGFKDQVNNHWGKIFGAAFVMSAITAGYTLSQPDDQQNEDSTSASAALGESMGQQMGQAGAKVIEKNLEIKPTLEIRPGLRFNIMVNKDIVFPGPYVAFKLTGK